MSTVLLRGGGRAGRSRGRPACGWRGDRRAARRHGRGRWLLLAVGAGLVGYLLFCHGCHGDEDNELFAVTVLKE